jgi:hypothetical protein
MGQSQRLFSHEDFSVTRVGLAAWSRAPRRRRRGGEGGGGKRRRADGPGSSPVAPPPRRNRPRCAPGATGYDPLATPPGPLPMRRRQRLQGRGRPEEAHGGEERRAPRKGLREARGAPDCHAVAPPRHVPPAAPRRARRPPQPRGGAGRRGRGARGVRERGSKPVHVHFQPNHVPHRKRPLQLREEPRPRPHLHLPRGPGQR